MELTVDPVSSVPPYEQVRSGIAGQITDGSLAVGDRLPTVRGLADQLGIAANTVARAYRELEGAGLVETRGRAGTVVSWAGDESRRRAQSAARTYVDAARGLGVPDDEALAIVRAAFTA